MNNVEGRELVGTLVKTVGEVQAQTPGETLRDVATRILVKTLAFKLDVVAYVLVDIHTKATTL